MMNTNATTPATTPATPSQHPRTNGGACESDQLRILDGLHQRALGQVEQALKQRDALRAELAAEQAAHVLDVQIFESGAREMAAVLDSTRARITEIVDAVKAERDARLADHAENTRYTFDALRDAEAHTDAMVRKHEGAGVSEDEAITAEGLEREGWKSHIIEDDEGRRLKVVHPSRGVWVNFDAFGDLSSVYVAGEDFDGFGIKANAATQRDLNTLVRLFTAPDAARARDEVK